MVDANGFAATFPKAIAGDAFAALICWLTTSIDFTGDAKRSPHDTWEDLDWQWTNSRVHTRLNLRHSSRVKHGLLNPWLWLLLLHLNFIR